MTQLITFIRGGKFGDTKVVINSCKRKDRQYNGQTKGEKIRVITKLPNTEQSSKQKGKTHE